MTKTVFRVSDQIRTNRAVRKANGLKFRIRLVKGLNYLCCKTNVLRGNHLIYKYVFNFAKINKIYM